MKRLISYITLSFLTGLTATSELPIMAGNCSRHINKTAEIKCADDDTECQTKKADKFELNKTVRS